MVRNILAIGAHFDDIELGIGGTIIQHIKNGDNVIALVVSPSGYSNPEGKVVRENKTATEEGKKAMEILGVKNLTILDFETFKIEDNDELVAAILKVIEKEEIDLVYTTWYGDAHRDHRNLSKATIMATRHVPNVLMYCINWYESFHSFKPRIFSDITGVFDRKKDAINAHKSEVERVKDSWIKFIDASSNFYGLKAGVERAEGFEVIRLRYPFPIG
jgi:LmbE family N-acetylglucosaminyl deacetylase